ncbi:hypothetical protein BDFB_008008 [Asbolus verrucosus]|uniref:Uncharacterized protein n=1 Tax=Asbolus verrucosus TaxID=1661398 RepID=A0A482VT60_ASBVE|nr:hypothetical protein BDFB_008008 [Asbolus verrucosus]
MGAQKPIIKMVKKYVGNNLNLNLVGEGKKPFLVVGNNCSVELKQNVSSIKIVGDNCKVDVLSGGGNVVYIGNNGAINLDQSINTEVVTYVGNNGTISSNGSIRRHCSTGDIRNCRDGVTIVNFDGQRSNFRTKVASKTFTKLTNISLPNIQIHLSGHTKHTSQ